MPKSVSSLRKRLHPYMAICPRAIVRDISDAMGIAEQFFREPSTDDGDISSPHMYRWLAPLKAYLDDKENVEMDQSAVSNGVTSGEFSVNMNVRNFSPEEISVKTVDNCVEIHAKHEEKSDDRGYFHREFTRRIVLPEDVDPESITCTMSAKGSLQLLAPRKKAIERKERTVPISVQHVKRAVENDPKPTS
ncbi:alpha-crystallin A chain-like [Ornithodoros turicata]|uniref:alpha-crystallin A chain-like n=1 Tax=Ornithodoros turicata TaxID=34597 RepID=UPI0031390B54